MLWMMRITTKLLTTSPPLSSLTLSHPNQLFIPCTRTWWWYVDVIHPNILFISIPCFAQLFGWDLKSLWKNAHQKRCDALRQAGRLEEAMDSYRDMMDRSDENTRAGFLDWSNGKFGIRNLAQAVVLTRTLISFQTRMQHVLSFQCRCRPSFK